MWTRRELKTRAKAVLKVHYWTAFGACTVISIITGIPSSVSNGGSRIVNSISGEGIAPGVWGILVVSGLIMSLIGLAVSVLVAGHFAVGLARLFLNLRTGAGQISDIFYAFKGGRYGNVFVVMLLRGLFIFLWSLLLIIPGIIKAYQYCLVPYILAENPEIHYQDALALSKELMAGHKMSTFVLQLSFIGWDLLGLLACCIGGLFVRPYREATIAELYCALRPQAPGADLPPEPDFFHSADYNY